MYDTCACVCVWVQVCEYVWCLHLSHVNMIYVYMCILLYVWAQVYEYVWCMSLCWYNVCAYVHVLCVWCRQELVEATVEIKERPWVLVLDVYLGWNRVSLLFCVYGRLTGLRASPASTSLSPAGLSPAHPYQVMLQVLSTWSHVPGQLFLPMTKITVFESMKITDVLIWVKELSG